jgi:hypothetical protein
VREFDSYTGAFDASAFVKIADDVIWQGVIVPDLRDLRADTSNRWKSLGRSSSFRAVRSSLGNQLIVIACLLSIPMIGFILFYSFDF